MAAICCLRIIRILYNEQEFKVNENITLLDFINTHTGRTTSVTIPEDIQNAIWWESNGRIGYRGERHFPFTDRAGAKGANTVYDSVAHFLDVPRYNGL
jgi:hypothetical protein